MDTRELGRTGVHVSPLCLGAMMFGAWGNPDHDETIRTIHHALDAGINFIDTADVYARGESEEIVGKALKGRLVDISAVRDRRGPVGCRAARPRTLRLRATAVLDPRAWRRDRGASDLRAL